MQRPNPVVTAGKTYIVGTNLALFTKMLLIIHMSLPKQAYSNILKISRPKNENFQIKNSDTFHSSAQNIDCGYSLELPQ